MAGAYLEIFKQDTYLFQANVLLNGVAVELYQSALWFTAVQDPTDPNWTTSAPFINLSSLTSSNVSVYNNNTNVNSVVNVTLTGELTANFPFVNSGFWSLVARTTTNAVYTLDRGRIAVTHRPAFVSYH